MTLSADGLPAFCSMASAGALIFIIWLFVSAVPTPDEKLPLTSTAVMPDNSFAINTCSTHCILPSYVGCIHARVAIYTEH